MAAKHRVSKSKKAGLDEAELSECKDIMRGYMAPRNDAINQFAQSGKVDNGDPEHMDGLVAEIDRELTLAEHEHTALCTEHGYVMGGQNWGIGSENERVAELSAMILELSRVRTFVIGSMGAVNKSE